MSPDSKTDPTYLGRIEYPEYNCYVVREQQNGKSEPWLEQRLYRLDNGELIGRQATKWNNSNVTAEGLLDNLLWKIDPDASKRRYQHKQERYFSGPYQELEIEEKMEFWYSRAHHYKRVGFERSPDSPAIIVLNKGWKDQQQHYHSKKELELIIAYIVERFRVDPSIATEMLKHPINSEEWKAWNRRQNRLR